MTKPSKKEKDNQQTPAEESASIEEITAEENVIDTGLDAGETGEPEQKPVQIASKQYVKLLKEEFKKEKISESIYTAFLNSVPRVDWPENYRLIWETSFRRPPVEK